MPLVDRLKERIALAGPMTVADYVTACLHDPRDGYYATAPRLGADGDFITAPLVSQMFGELIGLWIGAVWEMMGRPAPVRLVELGPGDGALMSDALRALRRVEGVREAIDLWLVEPSRPLRSAQEARLAPILAGGSPPRWAGSLAETPRGAPLILVANEVLDCLPARQFLRTDEGWAERRVGVDPATGSLAFGLSPLAPDHLAGLAAPPGSVLEQSAAQTALAAEIAGRIAEDGGAALLIDYGRDRPGFGDTLQALRGHAKVPPLEAPGSADLTMHVDFPAVAAAARAVGIETTAVHSQGAFLTALGIEARAAALARSRPDQAPILARQLSRLVDPEQMGRLFKVLALHSPGLEPPGLDAA